MREFVAQVWKNEKGDFEVHIPDKIEKSENVKEGDFVKITIKKLAKGVTEKKSL